MGSTNNTGEKPEDLVKSLATKDEENALSSLEVSSATKSEEPTFDTGILPWLQVVGSFFLFFNSW